MRHCVNGVKDFYLFWRAFAIGTAAWSDHGLGLRARRPRDVRVENANELQLSAERAVHTLLALL